MLICFTAVGTMVLKAQQTTNTDSLNNPFREVVFANHPTEIFTITASYANDFGPLTDENLAILQSINRLYGLDIKKFHYSITVRPDGSSQAFGVPCCDEDLYRILSAKSSTVGRLKLKCVVYRFYTFNGTTNFFYVDKAALTGI